MVSVTDVEMLRTSNSSTEANNRSWAGLRRTQVFVGESTMVGVKMFRVFGETFEALSGTRSASDELGFVGSFPESSVFEHLGSLYSFSTRY